MRIIFFCFLLFSVTVYGQSDRKQEKEIARLKEQVTLQEKTLEIQKQQIAELTNLLSKSRDNSLTTLELVEKFRNENETLREIMRGYLIQIEELNTSNLQLQAALDKCKDGK